MSILYRAQTLKGRHLTSVEADTYAEARRKVWKWSSRLGPRDLEWLRENDFLLVPDRGGCWGKSEGI